MVVPSYADLKVHSQSTGFIELTIKFMLCTSRSWLLCWKLECEFGFIVEALCSVGLWNVQASIYKSSVEEISIHQYASFLETCLLPLLHRSTTLLNPTKDTQTLHGDIASRGWACPVQDTSLLWQSRQIQQSPRSTSAEGDQFPQTKAVFASVSSAERTEDVLRDVGHGDSSGFS